MLELTGRGLGLQRRGNPGAQTPSWPRFHSLAPFNSSLQHMQFTLWYPAHVDFGSASSPEFRIYGRANRHLREVQAHRSHERGEPLFCFCRAVLTLSSPKEEQSDLRFPAGRLGRKGIPSDFALELVKCNFSLLGVRFSGAGGVGRTGSPFSAGRK